jgi:tRNA1(Val) A37 N6-methylase TrmN6
MAAEGPGDRLLGGRLTLEQPATGHRAGTDAILLAACAPEGFAGQAVDLGSGVGAVGLALAVMEPLARVTLVEIDPATAALARRNVGANGCEGRVDVVEADALAPPATRRAAGLAAGSATLVLTNPPFDTAGRVRASPNAARRTAHVMGEGDLDRWIRAALDLLAPRGTLLCIHRAAALPALLSALDRRFGAVAARPVLPRRGEAATRVLVRAVKGSRAPFALLAPLELHGPDGRFTPQAEAIHRGTARLRWD